MLPRNHHRRFSVSRSPSDNDDTEIQSETLDMWIRRCLILCSVSLFSSNFDYFL
jgi:hypothetical protein